MMDEMVERLMHVELVLEFKQVEFVLKLTVSHGFCRRDACSNKIYQP